jgi:hypothetical protein
MDRYMSLVDFLSKALAVEHEILLRLQVFIDGKACCDPQAMLGDSAKLIMYNI